MPERASLDSPRMRTPRRLLLSLSLVAVCALALGACGGDDEGTIPPENAAVMLQSLDDARGERERENCQGIEDAAGNLLAAIDELPDSVDSEVRTALTAGAENLQTLADDSDKCQSAGATGPSDQEPETTTEEFTEPPTTTTTTTTEEEVKPPPDQPSNEGGGGLGQGDEGGRPPPGGGPPGGGPPGGGGPPTGGVDDDEGDD